ncbi:MAG TPA: PmoA family protein [Tepidisphaeraceae bacterium]|nr:PmoA family protein [Tepidisphaeraceae bacterium]
MKQLGALLVAVCTIGSPSLADGATSATLKEEDGRVVVTIGDKPFTVYHFADNEGRDYVRPYFHPVHAADGTEVTSDQVLTKGDHPHHRSLWVSHGDVNGADHWSFAQKPSPKQRHVKFSRMDGDTFVQELEWETKGGQGVLLRETRTARFFAFEDGGRGIDLTLAFTPAGRERVTFGDTKEAGLCSVRVKKSISDNPTLTNARGQSKEKQVWGKPAEWCDLSGRIDGKPYGVAVLDHPKNPRHPSTWHAREYGLLAANIFGLHDYDKNVKKGTGDFTIEPGKTVTFRYRVVIHQGDAAAARLDAKFRDFAGEVARTE